jgi:hypothetical protein
VEFHAELAREFNDLSEAVQDELLAQARKLAEFGPTLGRPTVDTLKGSRIANLKELRFRADGGVWRSLSTKAGSRFCWRRAKNRGGMRRGFTRT